MTSSDRFHIITGGPGSGKTSLVAALAACGLRVMPEAGRAIIQDQVAIGGDALPWGDRAAFANLMLGWEMRSYREAGMSEGPIVFDRGIPDVIGYRRLCGLPVPPSLERAAAVCRYNIRVFVAPHWPAIFAQDAERRQDATEARATTEVMIAVYEQLGYELVMLPLVSVAARMRFVFSHVPFSEAGIE